MNFKGSLKFFIISIYVLGTSLTCKNPFSPSLGEKVDVTPPIIKLNSPVPGEYLKGVASFKGVASAYRELLSVEVRIFDPASDPDDPDQPTILPWTSVSSLNGTQKEKNWTYDLDTNNQVFRHEQTGEVSRGLEDGIIKIQFRALDKSSATETVELVYIVKNKVSDVRITAPDTSASAPRLSTGTEIRGQVTDRRGIKPGYPQIKIWKADEAEPGDNGWGTLFLPGYDDPTGGPLGQGSYADRYTLPVIRASQFAFKLDEFTIDPITHQIRYDISSGSRVPMETGKQYLFRIKTSDTFFNDDLLPIPENMLTEDQVETIGYYPPLNHGLPDEDPFSPDGEPLKVLLISSETLPEVGLDNEDIENNASLGLTALRTTPNIWITEANSRKIAVGRSGRTDFRLQVFATHPDSIEKAVLEYRHESSGRMGFLKWDDVNNNNSDYVNPANEYSKANEGYKGTDGVSVKYGKGKRFTFTADGGLVENNSANTAWYNKPIFTTSTEPYYLEVTATSVGGSQYVQRYVLYVDGEGPAVRIRSMKGTTSEPAENIDPDTDNVIVESPYTVNGNIHVTVNRADDSGFMLYKTLPVTDPNYMGTDPGITEHPMVKWIVEEDLTDYLNTAANPNTTLAKLTAYRNDPAKAGLSFFENIGETTMSGWVKLPSNMGSTEDQFNNFKFNTVKGSVAANGWDKQYLWLYIIAQDSYQNLGYLLQKIYVDDDSDIPTVDIPSLFYVNAGGAAINSADDLDVIVNSDKTMSGNYASNGPKLNILEANQGIELNVRDDDGVARNNTDVKITLTDLNVSPNATVTLTTAQIAEALSNGSSMEWSGTLSQRTMAAALYSGQNPLPASLRDGMYKIDIQVSDDINAKVEIDRIPLQPGDVPVSVSTDVKTYYFAVFTDLPEIEVTVPDDNSLQSNVPITISGTVKSQLKMQRLYITFNPDVVSSPPSSSASKTEELTLRASLAAGDSGYILAAPAPDSDGYYTYNWQRADVNFNPAGLFTGGAVPYEWRRYSLEAYDRLGNVNIINRMVQIDMTPPDVLLIDFNKGRTGNFVYGKISFTVSASDNNGIWDDGVNAGVKWWVLPVGSPNPDWSTVFPSGAGGTGGQFLLSDIKSGGRYEGIFDTRTLTNGSQYKLCVIAVDTAGNDNTTALADFVLVPSFHIDQDADYPAFDPDTLSPSSGTTSDSVRGAVGLSISGVVSDEDGFNADNLSTSPQAGKNPYIKIRFPATWNSDGTALTWGPWIDVPGSLDPSGAVQFEFNFSDFGGISNAANFGTYFNADGAKYYQIMVTDEPATGPNDRPPGKNPDGAVSTDGNYMDSVSKIFPSDTTAYSFVLDTASPEIFFNKNDPNSTHPSYTSSRPTFSNVADVLAALAGTVQEANLDMLSFSYGNVSRRLIDRRDASFTPALTYNWNLIGADLLPFDDSDQGPQSLSFEAYDVAGNAERVTWLFYKDTQGPDITTSNVSRSIRRSSVPAVSSFPGSTGSTETGPAWPSDWPHGTKWNDPTTGWSTAWKNIIKDWPSEYAYFIGTGISDALIVDSKAQKVINALNEENARPVSVVSGDPETLYGSSGYNPPRLTGRFQDSLSAVWLPSPPNPATYFYYRFNSSGRDTGFNWNIPNVESALTGGGWMSKEIEPGQNNNSANWIIILNAANGFSGNDGQNTVDIVMKDSAGNWSEIYGLRFVVDRESPYFGQVSLSTVNEPGKFEVNYSSPFNASGPWAALDEEATRVFSAAGAGTGPTANDIYLSLRGYVYDSNPGNLAVTISSDGIPNHTITAVWDFTDGAVQQDDILNNTITDTGIKRLKLYAPGSPQNLTGAEWLWTIDILQKDLYGLRGGAFPKDDIRHYISLTATDIARFKTGPVRWNFFLDTQKPEIEFSNLERGLNYSVLESSGNNIELTGTVSDDTKIQDAKYSIARWDYQTSAWRWYDSIANTWSLTLQPSFNDTNNAWPSLLDPADTGPVNAKSTVNWVLNQTKIYNSGKYPQYLFNSEGQYRIDLYVTDWSLGSGNPHNTSLVNDYPNYNDYGNSSSTASMNRSSRKFFIDRAEPGIVWDAATNGKTYFKNDSSGQIEFTFTVDDPNTITSVEAEILNSSGSVEISRTQLTTITVGGNSYDITPRTAVVKPFMTTNKINSGGTPLDMAGDTTPKTFTLRLYVTDGAGKNTSTTKQFILDNRLPELTNIQPAGGDYAVTGKMSIKGNTSDNSNIINKVAYYLANDFVNNPADTNFGTAAGTSFTAPDKDHYGDPGFGWHYYDDERPVLDGGNPFRIMDGSIVLSQIEPGTFTWELKFPNTRYFLSTEGSKYVYWTLKSGSGETAGLTYDGEPIPNGEQVGKMILYLLGEDEAGNQIVISRTYWIYPEGDRPIITAINNPNKTLIEADRQYNGNIRVSGIARDNERVKYVWFRVLDANDPNPLNWTPYTNMYIPVWDTTNWELPGTGRQTARNGDQIGLPRLDDPLTSSPIDGGWYMANGGSKGQISWWVNINTEGELERDDGANKIVIEVRVEDTTWDDSANDWMPDTVAGMVSRKDSVTAFVVSGAPIFENEEIKLNSSSIPGDWGDILNINIRRRAAYRIAVKSDSGLNAIRWTRTRWNSALRSGAGDFEGDGAAINLLDPAAAYNLGYSTELANVDLGTTAMAVKAEPKELTNAITSGKKYLIWNPGPSAPPGTNSNGDLLGSDENKRYTSFTASATTTVSGADFIEQDAEGFYSWIVTVDVNTIKIDADLIAADPRFNPSSPQYNPAYMKDSIRYPVYLTATDVSKSSPLTSSRTAYLPIDNLKPKGEYTFSREIAGYAATIGGEAGDDGPVNGIGKVVIWFSRRESGIENFISWHEQEVLGVTTLAPVTGFKEAGDGGTGQWDDDGVIAAYNTANPLKQVKKPWIPDINDNSGGDYAIVIDRNNPSGSVGHHGHLLPMGFTDGGMGKIWYVEVNSFGFVSGPVTMHVVVFDKAGNAQYYKEPLIIMNNAPIINRINLGTDIRDNSAFAGIFPANESYATGAAGSALLDKIRAEVPLGITDVQKGITENIPSTALSVDRIIDFNARNSLLAIRVETTGVPGPLKERHFRVEYVSGAGLVNEPKDIKAGRVYVIEDPGDVRWISLGAKIDGPWPRGYAFQASVDGVDENGTPRISGTGTAWELNTDYYNGAGDRVNIPSVLQLADVNYVDGDSISTGMSNPDAVSAEFVYNHNAFGAAFGSNIIDFGGSDTYPSALGVKPPQNHSLVILKVFDGDEEDVFADFALIRIRVNNNDVTTPFAQLYDLNPMAEGQDRAQNVQRSLSPMFVGEGSNSNRTKGGLWNTDTTAHSLSKSGHIEPRRITYTTAPYSTYQHSLSSAQMGGAATSSQASVERPWADPAAFFTTDTVSGKVILRGYVEDDQRIERVDLQIGSDPLITILEYQNTAGTAGDSASYIPPVTGFLRVPAAQTGNVFFTDSIDLYTHRIEWAYIWDTEVYPANTVVASDVNVRVISYNHNSAAINANPGLTSALKISANNAAPGAAHTSASLNNKGFPVGLNKYNSINMNLRPYISGFMRDSSRFFHNTRSLQGRAALARGETPVITGFNLGRATGTTTTVSLPGAANQGTNAPNTAQQSNYGLSSTDPYRYRIFNAAIPNTAVTDDGLVTLNVAVGAANYQAVNTGTERPRISGRHYIQPWNTEYSPGTEGSDLWDDFTAVHIWQSNAVNTGSDRGFFPSSGNNWMVLTPSMTINPIDGTLWSGHNEGGSGNIGHTRTGNNNGTGPTSVSSFIDPIYHSDVYYSPGDGTANAASGSSVWAASSIVGRNSTLQTWRYLGGVYLNGPNGSTTYVSGDTNVGHGNYLVESTYYNASTNAPGTVADPPTTDQFYNPHIITWRGEDQNNTIAEHIHVSYYDEKDGSIKYRYNRRGNSGNMHANNDTTPAAPYAWTNLDGGFDADDTNAFNANNAAGGNYNTPWSTFIPAIAANGRVVNYAARNALPEANRINAGFYNSIAVTNQGHPVVAYYDVTNQKLKMAVSSAVVPVAASQWTIIENVIPIDNLSHFGTGEYVSMRIDTSGLTGSVPNRFHIAALNSVNKQLVYISGLVNSSVGTVTTDTVQVVDSVGNVGRWSTLSLDADGNPWISYQDEGNIGSMDGVKMAYLNTTANIKDMYDIYGTSIKGWETMHVPAQYRVENPIINSREHGRLGMECFPTRNYTGTVTPKFWAGAVAYRSPDLYRIAYYVK